MRRPSSNRCRRSRIGLVPSGTTGSRPVEKCDGSETNPSRILDIPGSALPQAAELLTALFEAARDRLSAGRPDQARDYLRLLPRVRRQPLRAWMDLGKMFYGHGEFEAAGKALGIAAAHQPGSAEIQARLALVCLRLEDIPAFEGYLQRALFLDPSNRFALELLADVTRDHGDAAEAARLYSRLLSSRPRSLRLRQSLARCLPRLSAGMTVLNLLSRNRTEASAAPSIPSPGSFLGALGSDGARPACARSDADLPEP